jgi:hypothetical protein
MSIPVLSEIGALATDLYASVKKQGAEGTDKPTVTKTMNDVMFLANMKQRVLSISEKARKSVFVYPVIMSSSLQDVDSAIAISKYLEVQYGIFTLITAGINPVPGSDAISQYLSVMSAEDGHKTTILNDQDAEKIALEIMENAKESFREYIPSKKYNGSPRLGKYIKGTEAIEPTGNTGNKYDSDLGKRVAYYEQFGWDDPDAKSDSSEIIRRKYYEATNWQDPDAAIDSDPKIREAYKNYSGNSLAVRQTMNTFADGIEKYKANPTIINLKISLGIQGGDTMIPIAVKAQMHPVSTPDVRNLLELMLEGKGNLTSSMPLPSLSVRFIRFLTGELKFFRDIILQMDIAQKNKDLYTVLGKHPWYQRLMQRKAFAKLPVLNPIFKKIGIPGFDELPPTASLICSKEDLVIGTKLNYSTFLKNDKLITTMLDSLYLMCLGIYDAETDKVAFYFAGYKDPFVYTVKELGKGGGKDKDALMADALSELAKKV